MPVFCVRFVNSLHCLFPGLPEGVVPLFLSSKTQEIFSIRTDEDVTIENPVKLITKQDIQADMFNRAAISDFHPIKPLIVVRNNLFLHTHMPISTVKAYF